MPMVHQATSLHKALHPYAIVQRGRQHHTLCCCAHKLHTITYCGALVWLLTRLAYVPHLCQRPCIEALRCGHAHANLPSLNHSTPPFSLSLSLSLSPPIFPIHV